MALRIAVKRLSAVETDPTVSHQHEFHAGVLRRELELRAQRLIGTLDILVVGEEGEPVVVDSSTFTLYDAREGNPTRAAEWRLYYATDAIAAAASERDLLIMYPSETGLGAVIAKAGSRAEADLLRALELGDDAVRERFQFLDVPVPDVRASRQIATQLTLAEAPAITTYRVTNHPAFHRATREQRVPGTAEMATAAAEIVRLQGIDLADPDLYLVAVLDAESELYFAIEDGVYQLRLEELTAARANLAQIMDFSTSVQQSRRSRRGQSLQNHFATLLRDRDIPFTAQCETEPGETPDFLVPGCGVYHDPDVPPERLRMVACKSTAKERWRQILNEAQRIPDKYLLTVDPGLTGATITAMVAARLRPFLPRTVIEAHYASNPAQGSLLTVSELLDALLGVAGSDA